MMEYGVAKKNQKRNMPGLLFGVLAICGIAAILSGCIKKKAGEETWNKAVADKLSIEGNLQWQPVFSRMYFPLSENFGDNKIGYLVSGKNREKEKGPESTRQDTGVIEVYSYALSEEAFFSLVESTAEELEKRYEEETVYYLLNGNAAIEQLVQLDVKREHWLFIRNQNSAYAFHGNLVTEEWRGFLEDFIYTADLKYNGLSVMRSGSPVLDVKMEDHYPGIWRGLQFKDFYVDYCFDVGDRVLCFHAEEDGFYLKLESEAEDKPVVSEAVLRPTEIYPAYGTGEKVLSYFQEKYPDMHLLYARFWGEDRYGPGEEDEEKAFYHIEGLEECHGVFLWNGQPYEIISRGYSDMVSAISFDMGYRCQAPFLRWEREEDGSAILSDNRDGSHFCTWDLGGGQKIVLRAKLVESISEGYLDNYRYQIEVYDVGREEPLQEFQVISADRYGEPFVFEDFNADGYPDLTVRYNSGYDGSFKHYIWNPGKEEFTEFSAEWGYYEYEIDLEKRRLFLAYDEGGWADATLITYQWSDLMDYEMIKKFERRLIDNDISVKILRYDGGREEVLSDCLYSVEEYIDRYEIDRAYYEDFVWEKEITDEETGKKYMLRYMQNFKEEEAKYNYGVYYDGRLYVYDEDTYLIRVAESDLILPYKDIIWEDSDGDGEKELTIYYQSFYDANEEGGYLRIPLSSLIRPDYQPSG